MVDFLGSKTLNPSWSSLSLSVMASLPLKKNYRCVPSLQQFYTGGPFAVSSDGTFIACACDESIRIIDSSNASIRSTIDTDSEAPTALVLSPNDKLLFSAGHSRQIRVWDLSTLKCVRSWKVMLLIGLFIVAGKRNNGKKEIPFLLTSFCFCLME